MRKLTLIVTCAAVMTAAGAAVKPVEVRVRQTPGGPRIFVDGKAVRPRFYYGSQPCLCPISNVGKNVYTIPFRPDADTDKGRVTIDGFADDEPIWFSKAALIDKTDGTTVRLSSDGEERTRHFVRDGLSLKKGHLYHFVVTHPGSFKGRADRGSESGEAWDQGGIIT